MIKIGDVVVYKPTPEEKTFMRETYNCNVAEELPAFVVAVWSQDCVNLKVMYDGAVDDLWKTSVPQGWGDGQWHMHITEGTVFWNDNTNSLYVHNGCNTLTLGNGTGTLIGGTTSDVTNMRVDDDGNIIYNNEQ